jgi:hypothetical protein
MRARWLVVLSLVACRDEQPPAPTPAPPSPVATAPVTAPLDAPDPETLKQHMWKHFSAISQLQRAIARGHLDEAKELASWIASHPEAPQEGWETYLDQLHGAALEVAGAKDLPTAASLAARLVRTCSRCHQARDAIVAFAWELAPEDGPALQVQMKRHQWAAARLWDGLVGPSDELWNEGAGVLATAHLDTVQAAGGVPRGDVSALAAHVRELGVRAVSVEDTDERAQLYGELLSTCAGCHQIVRPNPVK